MDMEFWGVEVKSGETVKCDPDEHTYIHVSQVALGEIKKDKQSDIVPVYVTIDGKKLVIGSLSAEKCTQMSLDLIFEKEFEISHGLKNGSVFFSGYKSTNVDEGEYDEDSDSGSEEDVPHLLPLLKNENGISEVKSKQPKAISKPKSDKPDAGLPKPKESTVPVEDDGDSDEGDDDDDEDMLGSDRSDDEDDDDDSSDEETPVKTADKGKKRPTDPATKTPAPEKKAKLVTTVGGKTGVADAKKGGHTATPYPKQGVRTPAAADKPKGTPNSEAKKSGQLACKSCSRTFVSEQALDSHTKAKHSAA